MPESLTLDLGWQVFLAEEPEEIYYVNHNDGSTHWEPPSDPNHLPPGWEQKKTERKVRPCFYNEYLKESQWDPPIVLDKVAIEKAVAKLQENEGIRENDGLPFDPEATVVDSNAPLAHIKPDPQPTFTKAHDSEQADDDHTVESSEEPTATETKQGIHFFDLVVWITQMISLLLVIVGLLLKDNGGLAAALWIIALMLLVGPTIAIFLRRCHNRKFYYLRNIEDHPSAEILVDQLREAVPRIYMKGTCWHTELRTYTHSRTDGEGNTYYETETRQERVVTYNATHEFVYDRSVDYSGKLTGLDNVNAEVVKLRFFSHMDFGDEYTKECWDREENDFIDEHRYRDLYFDYNREMIVPGMKEEIMSLKNKDSKPLLLGYRQYMLSHLFLMHWPYLMWVRKISVKMAYTVKKNITRNPRHGENLGGTGISRGCKDSCADAAL